MARHVDAMLALKRAGAVTFELWQQHPKVCVRCPAAKMLLKFPDLCPVHPPTLREGKGPFRWVALSGDAEDIRKPTIWRLTFSRRQDAESAAATGSRSSPVSGASGAHLLAGLRRARRDGRSDK